jgi:hypothetical protein
MASEPLNQATYDGPNTCTILSNTEGVSEFRKKFVCVNDNLHENMQEHPEVLMLYVLTVIFIMIFLKIVTRPRRNADD